MSDFSELESEFQNYLQGLPSPNSFLQTNLFCQSFIQQKIQNLFPMPEIKTPAFLIQKHKVEQDMHKVHESIEHVYKKALQKMEEQYLGLKSQMEQKMKENEKLETNNKKLQFKLEEFIKECYDLEVENQSLQKKVVTFENLESEYKQNISQMKSKMKAKYHAAQESLQIMEGNYKVKLDEVIGEKHKFQQQLEEFASQTIEQQIQLFREIIQLKERSKKEVDDLNKQINNLKEVINEKETRNQQLYDMVIQLKKQFEKQKNGDTIQLKQLIYVRLKEQEKKHQEELQKVKEHYEKIIHENHYISPNRSPESKSNFKKQNQQQPDTTPRKRNCRLCEEIKMQKEQEMKKRK